MSESPTWKVDAWDLENDMAKIRQQWTTVRAILEDDGLGSVRAPEVSGWSCGEQAAQIVLVAQAVAAAIRKILAEPGQHCDEQPSPSLMKAMEKGSLQRGVAKAPANAVPTGSSIDESLERLSRAIQTWDQLAGSPELPEIPGRVPHFSLGSLNASEWVRFCAMHNAHHLAIVRDILDQVGDPEAGASLFGSA